MSYFKIFSGDISELDETIVMSLGLISGYGSGSDSEGEDDNAQNTPSTSSASASVPNPMQDRLKSLSEGGLFLPPPPPPRQ